MSKELKALEILKHYTGSVAPVAFTPKVISEAIKEIEEYEQNFKQKEFDYRTKCQSILSSENLLNDEKDSCNNCKFKDIHECVECLTCRRFWADNFELMKWQSIPLKKNSNV